MKKIVKLIIIVLLLMPFSNASADAKYTYDSSPLFSDDCSSLIKELTAEDGAYTKAINEKVDEIKKIAKGNDTIFYFCTSMDTEAAAMYDTYYQSRKAALNLGYFEVDSVYANYKNKNFTAKWLLDNGYFDDDSRYKNCNFTGLASSCGMFVAQNCDKDISCDSYYDGLKTYMNNAYEKDKEKYCNNITSAKAACSMTNKTGLLQENYGSLSSYKFDHCNDDKNKDSLLCDSSLNGYEGVIKCLQEKCEDNWDDKCAEYRKQKLDNACSQVYEDAKKYIDGLNFSEIYECINGSFDINKVNDQICSKYLKSSSYEKYKNNGCNKAKDACQMAAEEKRSFIRNSCDNYVEDFLSESVSDALKSAIVIPTFDPYATLDCTDISAITDLVNNIFGTIRIFAIVGTILLSSLDFMKPIIADDGDVDKKMEKAKKNLGTRLIVILILFLLPIIITVIFNNMGGIFGNVCR